MRKTVLFLLSLIVMSNIIRAESDKSDAVMDSTWASFRQNNPYCLQTVALRHVGKDCIFVISEPSETVSKDAIFNLFKRYGGVSVVKQKEFGYDGWLADVVGKVRFNNDNQQKQFTKDLFNLLYGTDYKAYYTNLDKPSPHTYYSNHNLNFSVTPDDLNQWFLVDFEQLKDASGNKQDLKKWLSGQMIESNKLLYSVGNGFVVWLINPQKLKSQDPSFQINARRFAIDADLIIGAMGKKSNIFAIIARERQVPLSILPPLRIETLEMLAMSDDHNLAQSYERYNVFAGKIPGNNDVAPIYLSDELWHTEYGNLLNVTDQMLKSWSENGRIDYKNFNYPKPIDFAFNDGALSDMGSSSLTYNWNTKGAGYVIEDDFDIYAINRTGSLPVSYFPDEMEGHVDASVYDAEELAYDFFSNLGNPDLTRVVQYAAFYQIVTYFKSDLKINKSKKVTDPSVPDYSVFNKYIEKILRLVDGSTDIYNTKEYRDALARFDRRYQELYDVTSLLDSMIASDPYGEFETYLKESLGENDYFALKTKTPRSETEAIFKYYLDSNVTSVRQYIDSYKNEYGSFPYSEAAGYFVSQRDYSAKYFELSKRRNEIRHVYDSILLVYYDTLVSLDSETKELKNRLDIFSSFLDKKTNNATDDSDNGLSAMYERVYTNLQYCSEHEEGFLHRTTLNKLIDKWNANEALFEKAVNMRSSIEEKIEPIEKEIERLYSLQPKSRYQRAMGALNWLLTDAGEYDIPSGEFFASKLTTHRQWTKSPSMCCSNGHDGSYGGHNLDAHITPIRKGTNVPKGKCLVNFENGNRVISVAKGEMNRITPQVLRKIERQVIKDNELVELPKPLDPMKKADLFPKVVSDVPNNHLVINDVEIKTVYDLVMFKTLHPVKGEKYIITRYNEREALVEINGQKYILERSNYSAVDGYSLDNTVKIEPRGDKSAVVLTQKKDASANSSIRAANIEFICSPELAPEIQKSVKSMMGTPSLDINNQFKTIRSLKMDLQNRNIDFRGEDIKMEEVIFSHVIFFRSSNEDFYGFTTTNAA